MIAKNNFNSSTILVLILTLCFSCHTTKYSYSGDINGSLDFSKGKWLLNDIDAPFQIKESVYKVADAQFRELIGSRFKTVIESNEFLIPSNIPEDPSESLLRDLKNGTQYDFLIDIKTNALKNEIGSLQIGSIDTPQDNIATVNISVYDLNLLQKIYSSSVYGKLHITKDSKDFAFAKSANEIILTGIEKLLKKMRDNSN